MKSLSKIKHADFASLRSSGNSETQLIKTNKKRVLSRVNTLGKLQVNSVIKGPHNSQILHRNQSSLYTNMSKSRSPSASELREQVIAERNLEITHQNVRQKSVKRSHKNILSLIDQSTK